MKNLNKIRRGSGFRGVLNYLQENADSTKTGAHVPGRLIGGTMSGTTPRGLAAEFGIARRLRPDVRKPVWHNALRLPPGDSLTDDQWKEIADRHCELMGFDLSKNQVCYWLHPDEQAVHIVASRVALDGSLYYGQNENLLNTKSTQQIEREFGLRVTVGPELSPTGRPKEKDRRAPKKGEIEMALRTGYQPPRLQIQAAIDAAISGARDMTDFRSALEKSGVSVVVHAHPETGAARGMSFEVDGVRFSGSQLGADYKFKKIEERIKRHAEKDRAGARSAVAPGGQRIDPAGGRLVARSASDQEKVGGARPQARHTGEAHRADGRADGEKGAAASRAGAIDKRGAEMKRDIFRDPPRSVEGRDYVEIAPMRAPVVPVEQCWIEGRRFTDIEPIPSTPPLLDGRLTARRIGDHEYDLHWRGRNMPTFRYHSDSGQVQLLAPPSEQNIRAIFDVAKASGMHQPYRIFGTESFQRAAAAQARDLGIEVHPEDDRVSREHEAALRATAAATAAAIERRAAEHEAEQRQRIAVRAAEEDHRDAERADRKNHPRPGA